MGCMEVGLCFSLSLLFFFIVFFFFGFGEGGFGDLCSRCVADVGSSEVRWLCDEIIEVRIFCEKDEKR